MRVLSGIQSSGELHVGNYFGALREHVSLQKGNEALYFLADYHSHWPVARMLGEHFEPDHYTSLDQSVWIHRDEPWDDFWLHSSWTRGGHAGRALGHRTLHTRDGRLVASMAQEALIPGARPRSA